MNIFKLIKEDLSQPKLQDPAFSSYIELFFNYPGVWSVVNYRFAHFFYEKNFKRLARIISGISTFLTKVDLHPGAKLGRRIFIDHALGVVIGQTCIIEDDVIIYQGVTLGSTNANTKSKRHPTIKKGVIIGSGAKILGNITVGENAKIGSNAVVVKDVPANSTAIGIPSHIIKTKNERANFESLCDDKVSMLEQKLQELERKINDIQK
ncbi:serine O-acetyltransferase [Campylobacter avium LMG 24591]|uniref:Serine acetyltransferase n=2 Tax=Campylobacter avium TaxID=522485 RepID=A0A222MXW8_9BACT|nr:serine O-acetyltransferase [Campylobacter avium]ASQ30705.1 serine O-acetyltransferase [Campylobacter avium LMG 24591]OYD79802.1 serine O-acetyltransferase [Campylobacter avium]HJE66391.1 serine O-acetyltransferase [Campylobacter avium]